MDWGEIEEALAQVRAGKAGGRGREELEPLSFLEKVDSEEGDQSKGESEPPEAQWRTITVHECYLTCFYTFLYPVHLIGNSSLQLLELRQ